MKLLFKTILALMLLLSQGAYCQTADDEVRFKEFWKEFARVVEAGDTTAFKKMSLERISCLECLENTEKERVIFNNFRNNNPEIWYDKTYEELQYINVRDFLKSDYKLIFDSNLIFRINNESKLNYDIREFKVREIFTKSTPKHLKDFLKTDTFLQYEAFVTFIDTSSEFEGAQYVFDFIKTKDGFKLYGISTIP